MSQGATLKSPNHMIPPSGWEVFDAFGKTKWVGIPLALAGWFPKMVAFQFSAILLGQPWLDPN
jgi:hypothetical protein